MRTTVTLHPKTISYLNRKSSDLRMKATSLLRLCMFFWFKTHRKETTYLRGSVKYQLSDGIRYKRIHVTFSGFEYESLIDSRKFRKRSVSSIATEAIYEFADKIETEESYNKINLDTYTYPSYKIDKYENSNNIIWNTYWLGHPKIKQEGASEEQKT